MKLFRARWLVLGGAFWGSLGSAAWAQAQDAEVDSVGFRAVQGPVTEDVPGGQLLVAAYATVLVLLVLYIVRLARLQAQTSREVQRLQSAVTRTEGEDS